MAANSLFRDARLPLLTLTVHSAPRAKEPGGTPRRYRRRKRRRKCRGKPPLYFLRKYCLASRWAAVLMNTQNGCLFVIMPDCRSPPPSLVLLFSPQNQKIGGWVHAG